MRVQYAANPLVRWAHRLWLKPASAAVAIGRSNREFYLSHGMPEAKVFEGAYFVEMSEMYHATWNHRAVLRQAAGFSDDDFVFCFVGKHAPFKRPGLLFEAAARLRAEGFRINLLIAGSGELTDSLRARADELNVPSHFTGLLNQTELWRAYVPSDALALPSDGNETWGVVINEAMLFNLSVIVSDMVGCGPDLVQPGRTGLIISGGVTGLVDAMRKLASDRSEATAMGRRGRELFLKHYCMSVATTGLKVALRSIRCGTTR